MHLITKYGSQSFLGLSWVSVMILLWLGFGINWVMARAMPALASTLATLEEKLADGSKSTATSKEEGSTH